MVVATGFYPFIVRSRLSTFSWLEYPQRKTCSFEKCYSRRMVDNQSMDQFLGSKTFSFICQQLTHSSGSRLMDEHAAKFC